VLLPGEPRKAKAIVLLPEERYRRKQRECCYWGEGYRGILPPGKRRRAEAINVLLSGNAGGGNKGSAVTGDTSYGAYDIGKILLPGEYYKRKP